jgi:hypothetical protein
LLQKPILQPGGIRKTLSKIGCGGCKRLGQHYRLTHLKVLSGTADPVMAASAPIPTVLRIDVEPDEFEPPTGERPWDGFLAMFDMIETLRRRLSDVTSHPVHQHG